MRDLALQAAGVLAIFVAIVHGAVGERQIFAKAQIEPRRTRRLLRLVWQASTVDWVGIGIVLIAAARFDSQVARHWIITLAVVVYGFAAVGNAVANRGRHVGWMLMSCVVALALSGL